jgi:hypothetical protein
MAIFSESRLTPGFSENGNKGEIRVAHDNNNGQQATYTLFTANGNAVCNAMASITWPNGDQYAWLGNWAEACGYDWYHSNVFIRGTTHQPSCLWIDKDGHRPHTAFQIHWPDFVAWDEDATPPMKNETSYYCNTPAFKVHHIRDWNKISRWPNRLKEIRPTRDVLIAEDPIPNRPRRRSEVTDQGSSTNTTSGTITTTTTARFDRILVSTSRQAQSASHLCESPSSRGPDLANSHQRLFCRMSDKTLWPFCDAAIGVTDNCFDADRSQQLMIGGRGGAESKVRQGA